MSIRSLLNHAIFVSSMRLNCSCFESLFWLLIIILIIFYVWFDIVLFLILYRLLTFRGSTNRKDSMKENRKEVSHSSDFAFPHSILYSIRKKAHAAAAKTRTIHATYTVQKGKTKLLSANIISSFNDCKQWLLETSYFSGLFASDFVLDSSTVLVFLILLFLNAIITKRMGGVVIITPMMETYNVDSEKRRNPISICNEEVSSDDDLKNIAFAIITNKRRTIKVASLCTRVKRLMFGRRRRETHKWWSVTFNCAFSFISVLNALTFSFVDTGSTLSIIPSSSSKESHFSQRNTYLKWYLDKLNMQLGGSSNVKDLRFMRDGECKNNYLHKGQSKLCFIHFKFY